MSVDLLQHPVLALWDAGYHEIIPVVPPFATIASGSSLGRASLGKIPGRRGQHGDWYGFGGWQKAEVTRADVEKWIEDGASFGMRTRYFATLDVDVVNPKLAEDIERIIARTLGRTPKRVGRAPKFAMPFRAEQPFSKMRLLLSDEDDKKSLGVIEVLCNGQQFVVHGTHPATGGMYTWYDGARTGGVEVLAARAPDTLPVLTADVITTRLLPELEQYMAIFGVRVSLEGNGRVKVDPRTVHQPDLLAPSIDALRDAVDLIPNDGEWSDRTDYIRMGIAIKAAAGPDREEDGFEIFADWCDRWQDGHNAPETVRSDWDSLRAPFSIGWGWVEDHARGFGYVGDDFDDAPDTISPAETEVERIAALIGDPDRALLLVLPTLEDGALWETWDAVRAAAAKGDPLKRLFREVVLPEAKSLRTYADESRRFELLLDSAFAKNRALANVGPEERTLLKRAAYALMAPRNVLSGSAARLPRLVSREAVPRDDLVEGLIPARSVAALVAAPAQGKSFLGLELACRVSKEPALDPLTQQPQPERFADRTVQHGTALIFVSEDVSGVRARAARWGAAHGEPQHLHIFDGVPSLSSLDSAITFMREAVDQVNQPGAPPVRLIEIDLFRDAVEGDENSSEVVGAAMQTARTIARMFQATVLLVHHSAIESPERGRGSSAFTGALDFIGAVTKRDAEIALKVVKNKNGAAADVLRWHLDANGVLRNGGVTHAAPNHVGDECARAAGATLRAISADKLGVSRSTLVDAMVEEYPSLFCNADGTNNRSRISRAIQTAVARDWATESKGKFRPGPVEPPDIIALLCAGESELQEVR